MAAHDDFFQQQAASAVLKHSILSGYTPVFASAAGSAASRVVLLDGYAGRGMYEDGSPGSPMLLLDTASRTTFRDVSCVFVEQDKEHARVLRQIVAEHGAGLDCSVLDGDLSGHLPSIIGSSSDAALFAFLDPFGTALSYEELAGKILGRPRQPPTEVLLHFSVATVRRNVGIIRARPDDMTDTDRKTVAHVNRFLGGDWWQEHARNAEREELVATRVAEHVAAEYCRRVRESTGCSSFMVPVRQHPGVSPSYYLILFTRKAFALWRFNDSLSTAHLAWQEAWRNQQATKESSRITKRRDREAEQGIMSLFDGLDSSFTEPVIEPFDLPAAEARWVATIEENLRDLFRLGVPFRPMDRTSDVYGEVLGEAREKHARKAVKKLHDAGVTTDNGVGDFYKRLLYPGPNAAVPRTTDPN